MYSDILRHFAQDRLRLKCCQVQRLACWYFQFSCINWRYILRVRLEWLAICLKLWILNSHFSNSTNPSITSARISLQINKWMNKQPTSCNPTWIWACSPYPTQESSWCRVGFTAYRVVGGLLASYVPIYFSPSNKEKISQQESNPQPLHSDMYTSPLWPGSLGSSRIVDFLVCRCISLRIDANRNI